MYWTLAGESIKTNSGDDWISLPSPGHLESTLMNVIGYLQKYGVICTATCVIMFFIFYKLAKIRKNMTFAKFWMLTSWGMVFLTVLFITLPYIVLSFY